METTKPIKMMGHHLFMIGHLDAMFLPSINDNQRKALADILKDENQKILLVASEPDFICNFCTKPKEESCFSKESAKEDINEAEKYGLQVGHEYLVKTLVKKCLKDPEYYSVDDYLNQAKASQGAHNGI